MSQKELQDRPAVCSPGLINRIQSCSMRALHLVLESSCPMGSKCNPVRLEKGLHYKNARENKEIT